MGIFPAPTERYISPSEAFIDEVDGLTDEICLNCMAEPTMQESAQRGVTAEFYDALS